MNKPVLYISIGALIAFLLSAIIVSSFNLVSNKNLPGSMQDDNIDATIFTTQSASIEGTIIAKEQNNIEIKGNNDRTETFPVSQNVQITKFEAGKNQPTVSSDPQTIDLNKKVSVLLLMNGTEYEVVNITYIPDIPTPPTPPQTKNNPATGSAKTQDN